jgi:hypothetical protein
MIDAEASRLDGASRLTSGDSLQEVLFKDLPVKPPPVAVDMYVSAFLPLSSITISLFLKERHRRMRPCCTRMLGPASQVEVSIRNTLIIQGELLENTLLC